MDPDVGLCVSRRSRKVPPLTLNIFLLIFFYFVVMARQIVNRAEPYLPRRIDSACPKEALRCQCKHNLGGARLEWEDRPGLHPPASPAMKEACRTMQTQCLVASQPSFVKARRSSAWFMSSTARSSTRTMMQLSPPTPQSTPGGSTSR